MTGVVLWTLALPLRLVAYLLTRGSARRTCADCGQTWRNRHTCWGRR